MGKEIIDAEIFSFIYAQALTDATNRVCKEGTKACLKNNKELEEFIKKQAEAIINGKLKKGIDELINTIVLEAKCEDFGFGKAQKLFNMVMKYLYIRYYDREEIRIHFDKCHAPMDRFMIETVYTEYKKNLGIDPGFKKDLSWSRIGDENTPVSAYINYQNAIKKIIDKKSTYNNPIEYEYKKWNERI